jgi:hypothetical protein
MTADEPDLLDVIEEIEHGPLPCPHSVNMKNGGWAPQMDPKKPYYLEYVHGHPHCRRSKFPGKNKIKAPTMGWSRELQKDVPL